MADFRPWRKSSYSGAPHQDCLEVSESSATVRLRDTQNRDLGHLEVPTCEWAALLGALRTDEM